MTDNKLKVIKRLHAQLVETRDTLVALGASCCTGRIPLYLTLKDFRDLQSTHRLQWTSSCYQHTYGEQEEEWYLRCNYEGITFVACQFNNEAGHRDGYSERELEEHAEEVQEYAT